MKTLEGFRLVDTMRGDTLQRVSARELGNAGLWYELAEINGLRPPYLTDDEAQVSATVKLTGSKLIVPASFPRATVETDPSDVLGRDIWLYRGELQVRDGDLAIVDGADNYVQALAHLVVTEPGDLLFHPGYGAGLRRFIGKSNSRAKALLASGLVKRAILNDDRTVEVPLANVTVEGDVLRIDVRAVAVHGRSSSLSQVI